jgi:preprotein translocase subunit Sec63
MVSSSVYVLLRLAGWSYIPDLATRQLLQFVHRFMSAPPSTRTSAFARHYRIAFVTVVLGFLSYNLVEALRAMPPNFYQILSVYPHAGEEELKQAFKLFARRYHPDRGGSQESFIQGRLALQTLKDPVTRFAYDR